MPDDEIDAWFAAEADWAAANLTVVQAALQWFMANGEWPEVASLRRQLIQAGRDVDVRAILAGRPAPPAGLGVELSADRFTLRARDLVGVREAAQLLNLAVEVAKQAVTNYRMAGAPPVVHSTDPAVSDYINRISRNLPAVGPQIVLQRLPRFMLSDSPRPVSGGSAIDTTSWQLTINEDDVMAFDDVGSPSDYVQRQAQLLRSRSEERQAVLAREASPENLNDESVDDRPAFIVMPFGEPWSTTTDQMIRAAAAALDPPLRVLRADDIVRPGRITDQIVEAIRNASLVIADVTGLNPNVMWELGYADALGMPVVILRQHDSAAPFDIYERRQVLYNHPATPEEENSLRLHMQAAVGGDVSNLAAANGMGGTRAAQPILTWEPTYEVSGGGPMAHRYGALRMLGTHSGAEVLRGRESSLYGFVLVRNIGNAPAVVDIDRSWVLGSTDEDQSTLRQYVHPTADNPVIREDGPPVRIGFRIPSRSAGWTSLSLEGFAGRGQTNGRFEVQLVYSDPIRTLDQRATFHIVSPTGGDYWVVHRVDYFEGDADEPVRSITFRDDD